jgi:hypothetical protein
MMRGRIALSVVIALVASRALHAQDAGALPARLSPAARDTIARLVDSARTRRLPTELLVAKASEGVLKGADDARVVRAVRSLLRELEDARSALPASSVATLAAAANALHAGVSVEELRKLAAAHAGAGRGGDPADLAVALITLADLVANSVPPRAAAASVEELLRRGTPEAEMAAFRTGVAEDIRLGRAPETAIATRTRASARP